MWHLDRPVQHTPAKAATTPHGTEAIAAAVSVCSRGSSTLGSP
jgi:hypothetical protein